MVNAHCHLELSFFKGAIPQHTGLVEFVKYVVGHRGEYSVEQQIASARTQSRVMWNEGIQAVGDISNRTESFAAKVESQIAYHTFSEYFGMPSPDRAQEFYDRSTANVATAKELGLAITPTPHSTYLVSDALFKMGATSPRLSIHFMETPSELGLFDRRGGMYDFMVEGGMEPDFLFYGSHPRRLVESLPADVPLLLIHNTQMKREDIEMVMSHFTDVTFVLCPRSNYYIEAAYPPVELFREMGARIALGTDSLSSNTSLSMVEEVKFLAQNNPSIPLSEILGWATIGGATALGMEQEMGTLSPGKRSGVVLLTDIDFKNLSLTSESRAERLF